MSKPIILAFLLLITGVAAASFYGFQQRSAGADWSSELKSPGQNYLVRMKGINNPPSRPYYEHGGHNVEFSAFKNGEPLVVNEPLYNGDEYDDLFLKLYPSHEWVSESVVRFGEKRQPSQSQYDEISISNKSSKYFEYLRLDFGVSEKFLVFDLAPGTKLQLNAKPQTDKQSDISGVICYAVSGGKPIEKSAGFNIRGKYKGGAHYHVEIADSGIKIKSDEFDPIP